MRAHRLDCGQQRPIRVVEVRAAPARYFRRIRKLFGENLTKRDCTAAFRRMPHPIERGLEATERERRSNAHHDIETRRLWVKVERWSFHDMDACIKIFRGSETARLSRESGVDLKTSYMNVELAGEPP